MQGVKSPLNDLPFFPEEILKGVDYLLVTHKHPDHFTPEYLPKDVKILAANEKDNDEIQELGFKNITLIEDKDTHKDLVNIDIAKTPTIHGDNEELALEMGDGSGYLLTGEKESLYIVGDTVLFDGVEKILEKYKPNVIVLNYDEATLPQGRLIMNLDDVKAVCELCPNSKVILTHLDSVNHALLSSEDVRKFVKENHLKNAIVPRNGEWIDL